jgi:hypothetical protein
MKMLLGMVIGGILLSNAPVCAEEPKAKSIEIVPETAVTVLQKVNAFFTGDLTWTMPAGKDISKDDYTVTPQGIKVPRSTLKKYDDGVR